MLSGLDPNLIGDLFQDIVHRRNLVTWKSNKQYVVARSSAKAKYKATILAT